MLGWLSLVLCALVHAQNASTNASSAPTLAPTPQPTRSDDFPIPSLPISKANALYPECRAEIIFVLDVSSSVSSINQKKMMRFVVQFMIAVEANILDARFGVVIFGIDKRGTDPSVSRKSFNATEFGGGITRIPGPYGNEAFPASTETALSLSHLTYNCTECEQVNSSWSQLEYMYTLKYDGWLTPTWDGLDFGRDEYERYGDPAVPGRFIVLVTDGVPNDGPCGSINEPGCKGTILRATEAVNEAKNGTLLLTVGVKLDNNITQDLMVEWASQPSDILAVPNTDYDQLNDLIGKILSVLCPAGKGIDCLAEDATTVDIVGVGLLNTAELGCRFFRDGESPTADHDTKAIWRNSTLISCPIPTANWFPGEWNLYYTQDGRGYYKGARFKTGTLCRPELLVIWWPFIALGLLPLAFCRSKKTAPATTQKVSRGVARPAPAATEEYEEYEEVEEIVAPPEPVNKWKVAPTAYIGFGRARMSVDWAGVAPESAPHEGVRKKVVKKVVSDHAPVPTAGPAAVPTPAPEAPTETVTQSRPQVVEEPDWVNSCLDRVAAIVCCCCVKKK